MSDNPIIKTGQSPTAPQLARDIVESILETPDALELMFGGSAVSTGSDISTAASDALAYEKQVFVEDSLLRLPHLPPEMYYQG